MGQRIELRSATVIGDVALFDTDRSITGQDGIGFESPDAAAGDEFPYRLAAELFAGDDAVDHVYIASNQVSVRRRDAWDAEVVAALGGVITDFFVFYEDEAQPAPSPSPPA